MKATPRETPKVNRYGAIIKAIFLRHYRSGLEAFEFPREEFAQTAQRLKIALPKNVGDLLYSFRFRQDLPIEISRTASEGRGWIIELAGRGRYRFRQARLVEIAPNPSLMAIKIPDATPEIISAYAFNDEQALLAKVRYNRLMDIFLGLATYSLQNHLRTTVAGIGQIEIDEVYVGINRRGEQFVLPVQAKGGNDRLSAAQTRQDIQCCRQRLADLTCRPISAQFMSDDVRVVEEKHYKLVPADRIDAGDLKIYRRS